MKTDIPLYRAKEIDGNDYIEGLLFTEVDRNNKLYYFICDPYTLCAYDSFDEIDPSTLSIHFEGMTDSEGTKIFASLSRDDD